MNLSYIYNQIICIMCKKKDQREWSEHYIYTTYKRVHMRAGFAVFCYVARMVVLRT